MVMGIVVLFRWWAGGIVPDVLSSIGRGGASIGRVGRLVGAAVVCLLAVVVGAMALGGSPVAGQDISGMGSLGQEIVVRDRLIFDQESLLNTYRCRFDIDIEIVPGGCVDGRPAGEVAPRSEPPSKPTKNDAAVRDRLIFDQESLLNTYRCRFDIDIEVVPGGCWNRGGSGMASPIGSGPPVGASSSTPLSFGRALDVASRLAPSFVAPANCHRLPSSPDVLPNSSRYFYRAGVHQGVDFACAGHKAMAALDGRVVVAVGDYTTPPTEDMDALLAGTYELQATPPYTLIMLYGNYVVLDHGVIDGVGHVVTVYAHLGEIDGNIRIGGRVEAGDPLGVIGNSGTVQAAAGLPYDGHHLHWELHINGQYLSKGLSADETHRVYVALFGESQG